MGLVDQTFGKVGSLSGLGGLDILQNKKSKWVRYTRYLEKFKSSGKLRMIEYQTNVRSTEEDFLAKKDVREHLLI